MTIVSPPVNLLASAWSRMTATATAEAIIAGAIAGVLFFYGTASLAPFGRDEARFAQASREMLDRDEWVVPTFAGRDRYDKPILVYWCTIAAYKIAGVGPRAARLPSNLAGGLAVALLAWTAHRRFGNGAGLLAGALLASTLTFHLQARACTADMVLMLPLLITILALERVMSGLRFGPGPILIWVGLAFAVLAKGPVAPMFVVATLTGLWALDALPVRTLVIGAAVLVAASWWLGPMVLAVPLVVAVIEWLRSGPWRHRMRSILPWSGVAVAVLIVAPWVVLAWWATDGAYFREAVGHHVVERSFSALESHGGFPGFYVVTGFFAALPWFGLVVPATARAFRRMRDEPSTLFLLAWFLGPLLVLETVQTKLVHYWMPSYPAGVLLVTGWLLTRSRLALGSRLAMMLPALATAVIPVVGMRVLSLGDLQPLAVATGLPLAVAALAAAYFHRRPLAGVLAIAGGCVLMVLMLAGHLLPEVAVRSATYLTAQKAIAELSPRESLVVVGATDDEIFFQLPVNTEVCRSWQCFEDVAARSPSVLGVARLEEFERYVPSPGSVELEQVAIVEGVDPGRGRWVANTVFRPRARGTTGGTLGS